MACWSSLYEHKCAKKSNKSIAKSAVEDNKQESENEVGEDLI